MSRTKGTITKLLPDASPEDKRGLTRFGELWLDDREFIEIALHLDALFDDHLASLSAEDFPKYTRRWKSKAEFETDREQWTAALMEETKAAIKSGKTGFYRKLMDAIEAWRKPTVDPVRSLLLFVYFDWKTKKQTHYPTLRELHSSLEMAHIVKEESHLRDICKEIGLKLRKGKMGAPKKSRGINSRQSLS